MKHFTRILSLLLIVLMVAPLGMYSLAAEEGGSTMPTNVQSVALDSTSLPSVTADPVFGTDEPIISAYYNAQEGSTISEFTNIDVINFHPNYVGKSTTSQTGNIVEAKYASHMPYIRSLARAQNPNIKFCFTIATQSISDFESWLANAETIDILTNNIMSYVRTYDYDGVDIDYEFPSNQTIKGNFNYFVAILRVKLDALSQSTGKNYILSVAIPATSWAFTLFDLGTLKDYVTYFNVMSYDLYLSAPIAHHQASPLSNQHPAYREGGVLEDISMFNFYGITSDKLVMGAGLYGYVWVGASDTNHGLYTNATWTGQSLKYKELIAGYINKNGYVRYWDEACHAPYLYNSTNHQFISYDDNDSTAYKAALVKSAGCRGLMVFDYVTCDGAGVYNTIQNMYDSITVHDHINMTSTFLEPTCTEGGIDKEMCIACGASRGVATERLGHAYGDDARITPATCQEDGKREFTCTRCGDTISETIPKGEHTYGEWTVTVEATPQSDGTKARTCSVCGDTQTESVPYEGQIEEPPVESDIVVSANNFKISIEGIEGATYLRMAKGTYTTASDIKNAEGVISLNERMVAQKITDGIFSYILPESDKYSIWIRLADGSEAIVYADTSTIVPSAYIDQITFKFSDLDDIKDVIIAKGTYDNYRDAANNRIMRFTETKIVNHSYSYVLPSNGDYTVCIRFNDANKENVYIHDSANVAMPTLTPNGISLKVDGLSGAKVIRVAKGEYDAAGDIKRATGARAFTQTTAIKGADSYTIAFAEEGVYSVAVCYANGLTVIEHVTITKKTPTIVKGEDSITFSGLDDLNVIRYARGTYTQASEIKRASGAKYLKYSSVYNDSVTVRNLSGTYTFSIQYYDGSITIVTYDF